MSMPKQDDSMPFDFAKDFAREDEERRARERSASKKLQKETHAAMEALAREMRRAIPAWQKAQQRNASKPKKKP